MKSRAIPALVFLFALLTPLVPAAAADAVDHVPAGAFVIIRFDSVEKAVGNFEDMLGGIGPAAAPARDGFAEVIGQMLEVRRNLDVIDGKSSACVAVFPLFNSSQPTLAIVKTKDETKLRRAVLRIPDDDKKAKILVKKRDDGFEEVSRQGGGRKWYFTKRGEYILYMRNEEIVKQVVAARQDGKSIADALGPRAMKQLLSGDASMAINVAPVVKKHKEDIEKARQQIYDFIKNLPDEQLAASGSPEGVKKMYASAVKIAFDALYDVRSFAGSVSFSAEGARAEGLVGVKKFSLTDWVLLANPPSPLENIELLPSAASVYYGLKLNSNVMLELARLSMGMAYGGNTENNKAFAEALENMRQAKQGATVASFSFPSGDKKGMTSASFTESEFPQKLGGAYGKFMKAFGQIENALFTQTLNYKTAAEKYKKHVIDLLTIKFKLKDPDNMQSQIVGMVLKKFYGGDELTTRVTIFESLMVQVMGNDPKSMRTVLDSLESGEGIVGLDKPYGKTRDALAKDANLMMMINVPQIIVDLVNAIKDVPPFNVVLPLAPFNFNLKPPVSYAGFSASAEPQGLRFKAFVPVEQPRGILQIFVQGL